MGVLTGIFSNKMYLYGTKFTVVVDHLPLVPMYKSHSKALPARVAKHKSKRLLQDVQQGKMSESTTKLIGIKECFEELSVSQGIILRGERLLIPTHEGCPGGDSMLRQLRMDVWWPGMHALQLKEMEGVRQGKGV